MIVGEPTAYHVMSRTALDRFPIGDAEKDYHVSLVKKLSRLYFVNILGFCCMGNHFHLLVRMLPETDFNDAHIKERVTGYYGKERLLADGRYRFSEKGCRAFPSSCGR